MKDGFFILADSKFGSVPGMKVALVASKKRIKTHYGYDARLSVKSYNCY